MGLKEDIEELTSRRERDYEDYKAKLGCRMKIYNDRCSKFDVLVGTINTERLAFRKEIKVLYDFLQLIGGSLRDEKRISVFDFSDEAPAPNQLYSEIPPLPEPDFVNNDGWDLLWKGLIGVARDHFKNKDLCEKFLQDIEEKKSAYDKDIKDRETQISYIKDAIEIAIIYRNIIVTVRDTVAEKILPELDLIQAFLYADAIRERVLDGETTKDIQLCAISEYKGTRQDKHYQFVKNTFDFYNICTAFFKQTVLADILRDRIVSEEEKKEFKQNIDEIKAHIDSVECTRMIANE